MRIASILIFTLTLQSFLLGNGSFRLFVPDPQNQQLKAYSIESNSSGFLAKAAVSLGLSFSPNGIAIDPKRDSLILTGASDGKAMSATVVHSENGGLKLVGSNTLAHPTGYTSVDRTGSYFMSSHYQSGWVAVYRIEKNGIVGDATTTLKTPNPEAHCIRTTPDNRFAYVPCVKNNNALFQFSFDTGTGKLEPLAPYNAKPPAMFGPRHVAYHPTLPIVYFSNEQQLGVSVFAIGDDGQLTDRQHATTLPRRSSFEQGKRDLHASDLVLSPDGKRLFVAVRDFGGDEDSVFAFRIEADGKLSLESRTKVGDIPWKLDISPGGDYLIVCESGDRNIAFFEIAPDGSLDRIPNIDIPSGTRDMAVLGPTR